MPTMPNVVGLGLSDAQASLQTAGVLVPSSIGYFGTWPLNIIWKLPPPIGQYWGPVIFATGDGNTAVFDTRDSNLSLEKVYISDWEGNQLQYTTSRTNLCTYSQDGSQWELNSAGVTVTINNSGAPDGTSTLNKITQDTSTGLHRVLAASTGTAAIGVYSCRCVVSQGNASYCALRLTDSITGYIEADFSFLTGTIISTSSSGSWTSPSFTSYSIGNGFYIIEITGTDGDGTQNIALNIMHYNGTTVSFTGDGSTYFYAWGVMITSGSTIGSYIATAGAIASHTDYSVSAETATFSTAPLSGAILTKQIYISQNSETSFETVAVQSPTAGTLNIKQNSSVILTVYNSPIGIAYP